MKHYTFLTLGCPFSEIESLKVGQSMVNKWSSKGYGNHKSQTGSNEDSWTNIYRQLFGDNYKYTPVSDEMKTSGWWKDVKTAADAYYALKAEDELDTVPWLWSG